MPRGLAHNLGRPDEFTLGSVYVGEPMEPCSDNREPLGKHPRIIHLGCNSRAGASRPNDNLENTGTMIEASLPTTTMDTKQSTPQGIVEQSWFAPNFGPRETWKRGRLTKRAGLFVWATVQRQLAGPGMQSSNFNESRDGRANGPRALGGKKAKSNRASTI